MPYLSEAKKLGMAKDSNQFDFLVILKILLVESLPPSCEVVGLGDNSCRVTLARHKSLKIL